jgi:acid stress-induced BolA-like protein IbaG/YrbA
MKALTKNKLERVMTSGLHLDDVRYEWVESYGRISGHVISPAFRGVEYRERQRRMWDALEAGLEAESLDRMGILLAFTPEEWDFSTGDVEDAPPKRKRKTAG